MNVICLVGRLTKEPEYKVLDGGTAVANFSLAVQRPFKDKKTEKYEADFFDVECFGKTADFVTNHCGKGRLVSVQGRHESRTYQTQDGSTRKVWDVKDARVQGVGPAPESAGGGASAASSDDPWAQE